MRREQVAHSDGRALLPADATSGQREARILTFTFLHYIFSVLASRAGACSVLPNPPLY